MGLKLITAPAGSVVTLDEFKNAIGIFNTARDSWASRCLATATKKAERATGRQLLTATWEASTPIFPQWIKLGKCPVKSIVSIKYYDQDNVEKTIDHTNTKLVSIDLEQAPAFILFKESYSVYNRADAVRIRFESGYGEGDDVPDDIISGIILYAGKLFENPVDSVETMPTASANLFKNFRYYGSFDYQ